jgi:hypothetical protein
MMGDRRASALVQNFAGQWLMLRNIRDAAPDPDLFPNFDENLREAFRRETELFIESQVHEGPRRTGAADGELYVPERAARPALRRARRQRHAVPAASRSKDSAAGCSATAAC